MSHAWLTTAGSRSRCSARRSRWSSPRAATTTAAAAAAAASSGGKKNYKMTLIAGVKGDEFYITMNCGAQAKAKELGVTLDFQGPDQFDAALQTPIVNAVAAKKPDAVLIAPTDTKAMYAPIKQLADAGIEDRARRHHARAARHGGLADRLGQRGRRQGGRQGARRPDRRQGQGVRHQRQAGHLDHRRARARASRTGAKAAGLDYVGQRVLQRRARRRRPRSTKAALAKNPDLEGHLRHQPVLGRGRRDRRARGGQAGR